VVGAENVRVALWQLSCHRGMEVVVTWWWVQEVRVALWQRW
jgi:hypothetical protein